MAPSLRHDKGRHRAMNWLRRRAINQEATGRSRGGFQSKPRSRNRLRRAKSRSPVELLGRCLRKRLWIQPIIRLSFIQQRAQCRPWTRIANNTFPRGVSVQLRQQLRRRGDELFTLCSREILDGRFDFLHRAYDPNVPHGQSGGKLDSEPALKDLQPIAKRIITERDGRIRRYFWLRG